MKMDTNLTYQTSDFYETAVLYSAGMKLVNTSHSGQRINFYFNDFNNCESVIKKYFAHELKIDAMDLIDAIKTVKTLIFRR